MAVEYIEAVYRLPDLTSTEVLVLGYLANKSNAEGECWPSRSTIAKACRLHPDTVKSVLQGLADPSRKLLRKEVRTFEGRQTSNRLVLCFEPIRPGGTGRGDIPPTGGVYDPRGQGADHPSGGGTDDPREEPSYEPSKDSVARWAKRIWEETPAESRKKSTTKAQLEAALLSARRRGHDLARVAEGLRRYFDDPDNRRDKCRAMKGVHRVVQNDLWETWAPPTGWVAPAEPEEGAEPGPAASEEARLLAELGTLERPGPRRQRAWLEEWKGNPFLWKPHVQGPEPGAEGCRCDPDLLREFGVEPFVEAAG